jgi:hypothetical protein
MAAIVGANNTSKHATPNAVTTAFDMTRSHKAGWSPMVLHRFDRRPCPSRSMTHSKSRNRLIRVMLWETIDFIILPGVKHEGRKMV